MTESLRDTQEHLHDQWLTQSEVKGAAVLNNAFDSTVTGGDGKELCATDHPLINGGTFANEPSTAQT